MVNHPIAFDRHDRAKGPRCTRQAATCLPLRIEASHHAHNQGEGPGEQGPPQLKYHQ